MKYFPTRRILLGTAAASAVLAMTACGGNVGGASGSADAYPSKPINVTVGAAPGGSTDLIARAVAEGASEDLGVAMPVVNKPGANGALALKEVQGKAADGYELATLNASLITITPLAVSEAEAVSLDDVEVIVGLSQDDYVLVANPEAGVKTVKDLTAAKDLTFGTTGVGTGSQLAQALLLKQAGIKGTEVPFDSGAPAVTAVLGNQVQLATVQLGEAKAQIDAGKLVPVVVFSTERNKFLPDVPTATEEGYDIPVSQYRAMVAPKGTPEDVQARLKTAFENTFKTEAYQQFNEQNLLTPREVSGEEVVSEWTELAAKYKQLTEKYDISLQEN
ncbi:Bug family tripartite tricarboxylate transporter substrate binding protein [Arthrobacter mobilis]|uniref:Tripartite tricarboxylate transporter substrate binding protein n=1 Tax=Arthrobacter mobilis TaxID=2724944 RepID=A0A7X6HCY2_9MICC|nr:tripartite tricarboxylate transporter substrate binding protein [Arthrobacter mobilis]NKX54836.1 tripartite tricarboxylate transporter substrate binding protein [Arthrobacter mobilis]